MMSNRYVLEQRLGQGGFGDVYRAYDRKLERRVALKLFTDGGDKARLITEARAAAALSHPNVVGVFEVDDAADPPFMVMELVEGQTLRERMSNAPLQAKRTWLEQIASALAAAHRAGFIHRDVKPENVLITNVGDVAKVLDFGIAKRLAPPPSALDSRLDGDTRIEPPMTQDGRVTGTLHYMAPERLLGHPPGPHVDQWSWGVVAYELLAGVHPSTAAGVASIHQWILSGDVPPLGTGDALPPQLTAIVMRALSREVSARFASMGDLHAALMQGGSDPAIAVTRLSRPSLEAAGPPPGPLVPSAPTMISGMNAGPAIAPPQRVHHAAPMRPQPAPRPRPPASAVSTRNYEREAVPVLLMGVAGLFCVPLGIAGLVVGINAWRRTLSEGSSPAPMLVLGVVLSAISSFVSSVIVVVFLLLA